MVAKAVGVSAMTVSRALRGEGRVSAATVARVKSEAERLGYRPNPLVQTLMAGIRDKRVVLQAGIAWIEAHEAGARPEVLSEVEHGARRRAESLGFSLELVRVRPGEGDAASWRRIFRARGIRAGVVAPLPRQLSTLDMPWDDFAFAAVGRSLMRPALSYVMAHHHHGMERVLAELSARGFRRVGLLMSEDMDRRVEHAALMAFTFAGRKGSGMRTVHGFYDGWSRSAFRRWVDTARLEVVLGGYPAVEKFLRDGGVKVPEEVAFATLSWRANFAWQAGVRQRMEDLGAAAVDLVVAQLHRNERGVPPVAKAVLIEGEWMEGETLPWRARLPRGGTSPGSRGPRSARDGDEGRRAT
jgi:LacI family transcriptional regulator